MALKINHYLFSALCFVLGNTALQCPQALCETQSYDRLPASPAPPSGNESDSAASSATPVLHSSGTGNVNQSTAAQGNQGDNSGVSSAPGADAMMTRDLLLVNPAQGGPPPKPLQSFVGVSLKLVIERSDVVLDGLRGLMITVTNDTSRPLVIDGDNAQATVGEKSYLSAPLPLVQKCVLPNNGLLATTGKLVTNVVPAAVTVGAIPTIKDFVILKKPISKRYGPDERRRIVEASRFGKRIVWPHQRTEGIIYFQTNGALTGAKLQMPVHTLFDKPDSASLSSSPN